MAGEEAGRVNCAPSVHKSPAGTAPGYRVPAPARLGRGFSQGQALTVTEQNPAWLRVDFSRFPSRRCGCWRAMDKGPWRGHLCPSVWDEFHRDARRAGHLRVGVPIPSLGICSSQLWSCPCSPAGREATAIGTERVPARAEPSPAPGGSRDKSSPTVGGGGFGGSRACSPHGIPKPAASSPRATNKQAPLLFVFQLGRGAAERGYTLQSTTCSAFAQGAAPLFTARIPALSSLEAVKMYFLLCHFSFWQAGSQVGLENVKVGNKVVS